MRFQQRGVFRRTHGDTQIKVGEWLGVVEWHTVAAGGAGGGQGFRVTDQHAARALCGQRIHAQLVIVAERGLQQRRIDARTDHVFKHLLAAGFFNRHGFA